MKADAVIEEAQAAIAQNCQRLGIPSPSGPTPHLLERSRRERR